MFRNPDEAFFGDIGSWQPICSWKAAIHFVNEGSFRKRHRGFLLRQINLGILRPFYFSSFIQGVMVGREILHFYILESSEFLHSSNPKSFIYICYDMFHLAILFLSSSSHPKVFYEIGVLKNSQQKTSVEVSFLI